MIEIFPVLHYIIFSSLTEFPFRGRGILKKVQDFYFKKAKKEHFAARSVYKLQEIDRKYRLVKPGMHILDIGCTPGSWSQYLLKKIGGGRVVGVDIREDVRVSDPRFTFFRADLMQMDGGFLDEHANAFDLIVSDAAPSTSGNKFIDSQASLAMVQSVFRNAETLLKPDGSVVAKIFQGEDVHSFVQDLKNRFGKIHLFKPTSSRKESKELFIIALRRRDGNDSKH